MTTGAAKLSTVLRSQSGHKRVTADHLRTDLLGLDPLVAWRDRSGLLDVSPTGEHRRDESLLGPRTPANRGAWDRRAALIADAPDLISMTAMVPNREAEATEHPDALGSTLRAASAAVWPPNPDPTRRWNATPISAWDGDPN